MLELNKVKKYSWLVVLTLLYFISVLSQTKVFAEVLDPSAEQYRAKGYEEYKQGNLKDALYFYNQAVARGYKNAIIYNDLGILYEELNRLEEAEKYYLMAIDADSNYLPVYTNIALFYKKNGPQGKAVKYLKLRYELASPDDPWRDKVKKELIDIHPDYANWFVEIEAKRLQEELVSKARAEFIEKVRIAKERSKSHYERGASLLTEQKLEEAIAEFDEALKLTPGEKEIIESRKKARLDLAKKNIEEYTKKALDSLSSGDSSSAKEEIQKMLTVVPND